MRNFASYLVGICLSVLVNGGLTAASHLPNIVVILADDLGYGDLGCYGSERNRTPHIDQLAREGLRFTDFHSNGPMCSPTRAALLTGRYQQRVGIERALNIGDFGLPHEAITIAERLKEAGYATAVFGKWHLGSQERSNPLYHGFDVFRGHLTSATDYKSHVDRDGNYDWFNNKEINQNSNYNTIQITEDAVGFIEKAREKPFFMYVSHSAIHFPWMGPMDPGYRKVGKDYNENLTKLGPRGVEQDVSHVVTAMIESLDDSVGRIIEALDATGKRENTLVIFTSDNGGYIHYSGNHQGQISSNGPYRDQKSSVFEGGHRVPAIFWWPTKIEAGRITDETVLSMDIMPTLLPLAELEPSGKTDLPLDGENLLPLLFEHQPLQSRGAVFWRMGTAAAVRQGPWKLVRPNEGTHMLFNLKSDPGETRDLAAVQQNIVVRLKSALAQWERDVDSHNTK